MGANRLRVKPPLRNARIPQRCSRSYRTAAFHSVSPPKACARQRCSRDSLSDQSERRERRGPWPHQDAACDAASYFESCWGGRSVIFTPPCLGRVKLSSRVGEEACAGKEGAGCCSGSSAERRAPSTSCAQWIFIGGNGPNSPASSPVLRESASSGVLPRINSVARLATAIAVSHPKD